MLETLVIHFSKLCLIWLVLSTVDPCCKRWPAFSWWISSSSIFGEAATKLQCAFTRGNIDVQECCCLIGDNIVILLAHLYITLTGVWFVTIILFVKEEVIVHPGKCNNKTVLAFVLQCRHLSCRILRLYDLKKTSIKRWKCHVMSRVTTSDKQQYTILSYPLFCKGRVVAVPVSHSNLWLLPCLELQVNPNIDFSALFLTKW